MNGVKPQPTPPFELNHIRRFQTLEENLGHWDQRREIWQGDTFSFDYCLGRVIAQDMEALGGLGLNGLMSCQELRCGFPTALLNYVMGLKLWQPKLDIRALIETCFSGAFGAGWGKALLYLERVSAACSIDDWLSGYPAADPQSPDGAVAPARPGRIPLAGTGKAQRSGSLWQRRIATQMGPGRLPGAHLGCFISSGVLKNGLILARGAFPEAGPPDTGGTGRFPKRGARPPARCEREPPNPPGPRYGLPGRPRR